MKVLGLIGGTSYLSTACYYQAINRRVNERLKGMHSATCLIHSFNYAEVIQLVNDKNWIGLFDIVSKAAGNLKYSGADAIVMCANTLHAVAERLEEHIQFPVIHIAKETVNVIKNSGIEIVGLIGTKPTMEQDFFRAALEREKIQIIVPDRSDREIIHQKIFRELGVGQFTDKTKKQFLEIMHGSGHGKAQAWILGCTELSLLIKPEDMNTPVFDTTAIHIASAVRYALGEMK
jgi:aspartate racemase